jgi:hypothetical protein
MSSDSTIEEDLEHLNWLTGPYAIAGVALNEVIGHEGGLN